MKIRKQRVQEIVLLLVVKVLLEVAYVFFVTPHYAYFGFVVETNGVKLLESYLFLIFLYTFLPSSERRISAIAAKLLYVFIVIPTLSFYALANQPRAYMYLLVVGFWLTLLIIQIFPKLRIKKPMGMTSPLLFGLAALSIGVYAVLIKINGLPTLKALDLSKVYEIRAVVTWGPSLMGYLVPWLANVINPFFLSIAWYKRRYFAVFVMLGLQLFLFLITGHKSFLLAPLLVVFVIYAIYRRDILKLTLWGLIAAISGSLVVYAMGWSIVPASLLIRRVLFVPAKLSFHYYDFFSSHQLMYLAQSHLNPFLSNPYSMPTVHLIGKVYYNNPVLAANTGYLGDAYMNFGFLGVLVFSGILGMVLVMLDSITAKTNITVAIGATITPIFGLVNGALFTVLGTKGLLLGMLIVWLYSQRANHSATLTEQSHLPPLASRGIEEHLEVTRKW